MEMIPMLINTSRVLIVRIRRWPPSYKVTDLIPPVREDTFAPEVDPVGLIDDEAEFITVNDWSKPNLQQTEGGEPAREEQ